MIIKQLITFGLFLFTLPCLGGQIITDGFVSKFVPPSPDGPPGNIERLFNVYLPPQFFTDLTATFPIVYHLVGFIGTSGGGNFKTNNDVDKAVMDQMLAANQVMPMIIIFPDPRTDLYGADFYVNSVNPDGTPFSHNGLFENYFIQELIPFVDAKYRQRRDAAGNARSFRALMGQSMGGYGSLFYGIKHDDLFIAYAGDSSTSFWVINTPLATPDGNVMFTFNKLLMPELELNDGVLTPQNGDNTFGFFAWAAAFSPNPARPFLVNYPFVVIETMVGNEIISRPLIMQTPNGPSFVPVPEILARWETFDPYTFIDTADKEVLRRQSIYLDAGADPVTEIVDNVGARYFSLKLSQNNIKNEYVLFQGGHTTCTTLPELPCSRFQTNLQTFSAKFSENGIFADDVRTKITGIMTLEFHDNAVFSINNKKLVGIETNPTTGVKLTDVTIALFDSARLEIGNATTIGGGLQVGSPFGKANFVFDPTLLTDQVFFTLTIDGPQATVQIGRQGFLGFGVGINGNQTAVPNFWGVSTLTNLISVNLNFFQGQFLHNEIASSITAPAALLALGECGAYSLSFEPNSFTLAGGGNLAKIVDTNLMHPTVIDTAGMINQGGIRNNEVIVPDPNHLFDEFYGPPNGIIGSETFYTNQLTVNILASGQMLVDTRKMPIPAHATLDQFFTFLQFDPYLVQGTKRAAFNVIDGIPTVGFLPNATTIDREPISTTDPCTPLSPSLNIQTVVNQGAIGIKLATINGQQTILRLYDLDPPG